MNAAPTLAAIEAAIEASGMTPRGAFRPTADDGVPDLGPGRPARTLVLAGNVGPTMWRSFQDARDPANDLLDDWSREVLDDIADRFHATAHYPSEKPYLPFQRWARGAEPVFASPLGIHIHADFGLWHSYRGALSFAEVVALPDRQARQDPCETCPDRPCLSTCPACAFGEDGYDIPACVAHLKLREGQDCMQRACRARRACPLGQEYRYLPAQANFHMRHFLRTRGHMAANERQD